jgi:hypothetical protein
VGRGGYNGGSTIIGAGRSWSFDPDFDFQPQVKPTRKSGRRTKVPQVADPAIMVAGKTVGKKVLRKHKLASSLPFKRDELLVALGRPLPKKPELRRAALKQLVTEQILLQTGTINIAHPAVAAWLKTHSKKKKVPNGQ